MRQKQTSAADPLSRGQRAVIGHISAVILRHAKRIVNKNGRMLWEGIN